MYSSFHQMLPKKGRYGKPGTPEQPESTGTVLFLRLESHASTSMPDYRLHSGMNEICLLICSTTLLLFLLVTNL